MKKQLKPTKTLDEQIEILAKRGVEIGDREKAKAILSNVNYYVLKGYLAEFRKADGSYQEGTTFEQIFKIYEFDSELREILLSILDPIEQRLKAKISYQIAQAYPANSLIYMEEKFYQNKGDYQRLMTNFNLQVKQNKTIPYVRHHLTEYGGQFPIWVAIELFTLGNLKFLYKNIPNPIRRKVAAEFDVNDKTMENWINNIRTTRNFLAHEQRIYRFSFFESPSFPVKLIDTQAFDTRKIFIQVLLMKFMYPHEERWLKKMQQLTNVLVEYFAYVKPFDIGFPENWQSLLLGNGWLDKG